MIKSSLGEVTLKGTSTLIQAELATVLNTLYEKKILTEEQLHETVTYGCHPKKPTTNLTPEEEKKYDEVLGKLIDVLKILDDIDTETKEDK